MTIKRLVSKLVLATVIAVMVYLLLAYLAHIALRLLKKTELTLLLGILKSITRVKVGG